ncbi:trans-sulfuration enzyme family protein [Cupriavidus alkaliphilus]|uniref:Methionine-gamma-lyase n=1 Tax=Cupriavidus alkaliphilus TaxID=942866 RepID=A0A7W4YT79_9BURK|nr:aminotransferase class I/II-fold pyridoxal phosphate-dependent enzyme [Cupriavidus alkaliphilus]MBB3009839.1 methionine-gamma-lyase [Cupriavidus alkaliphilus]
MAKQFTDSNHHTYEGFAPATRALHIDRALEPGSGVAPAIMQSVTYFSEDGADFAVKATEPLNDLFYARHGNPTASRAALIVADMEGKEAGIMFASGMAAITTTLLSLLSKGDHVVAQKSHYIGTTTLMNETFGRYGIHVTLVDQDDTEAFARAIQPSTKVFMLETPVNPTMKVTDLRGVSDIARKHGITTVCDNTFATPFNQRPGDFGVDIVVHSATKYMGGHHDLLGGVAVGSKRHMDCVWDMGMTLGGVITPFNAWLVLRGLRTMKMRVDQSNKNGLAIAQFLEGHEKVSRVYYPGLESHEQHALAREQMNGYGGLLTFDLKGGFEAGQRFIKALKIPFYAASLGGIDSLVIQPAALWLGRLSPDLVGKQGVDPGLIRFSAGIEETDDLLKDIGQALEFA